MSSNIDFKALWQQQSAGDKPDINAVIKKAMNLKRKTKSKLIWANLVLVATAVLILFVGFNLDTHVFTTTLGIVFIVLAIVAFIVVSNGLHLSLFKSHPEADTFTYLIELTLIQKKQQFIHAKVMRLYYLFLGLGLFLYMIEFEKKMSILWGSVFCICTFGWLAFAYFYITPREFNRRQAEMNNTIAKLQAINEQLTASKEME
ncbi:hypothetical protein [Mucilaginibacter sp. FT3.2]|uniref:hypothetical protein n=1 Tax=Mucilaginibacter sp. FT3.2 TaxID=2723090 RepID=UPI00160A32FE|nr:hypothetical protein [Mucilaginibacter sp. FT3.2]MBB6231482.1 Flp pilus assembly protein TadB [Mucilaginibacter sp. FT3.2]